MKTNIATTTLLQLGILMALFCFIVAGAEDRPNQYNRRSHGWTPQALYLYGIMPPRQKAASYNINNIKRTVWGPRANIMRAWRDQPRVSRDVSNFLEVEDDNKRAGWTGRERIFGRAEAMDDKRVPEETEEGKVYEQYPMLKRMMEIANKRLSDSSNKYEDGEQELQ